MRLQVWFDKPPCGYRRDPRSDGLLVGSRHGNSGQPLDLLADGHQPLVDGLPLAVAALIQLSKQRDSLRPQVHQFVGISHEASSQ